MGSNAFGCFEGDDVGAGRLTGNSNIGLKVYAFCSQRVGIYVHVCVYVPLLGYF